MKFTGEKESPRVHFAVSTNQFQCQELNCFRMFVTTSGLKTHVDREHKGKRYLCSFCRKYFASKFSLNRHILDTHNDEDEHQMEIEVVYEKVYEIVPKEQEDAKIQQQANEIEELESIKRSLQDEIKVLREQVKSMRSNVNK